jgi:V-type H+-transporting ATPase subunit C
VEKPKNSTKQVKQKKNYGYYVSKTKLIKNELVRITKAAFADIFQAWTHLKALRIFVESVLRYGLPPEFISAVIKVCPLLSRAEVA